MDRLIKTVSFVIVLLGIVHIGFSFPLYNNSDILWFIGSGMAIVFAGLLNFVAIYRGGSRFTRSIALATNALLCFLFCFALAILDQPQVYVGVTTFLITTVVFSIVLIKDKKTSIKLIKTIPALPVQDIQESMQFYATRLGFNVRHHDDGFCIVVRDEIEIHLWKSNDKSWKEKGAQLSLNPICSGAESFLAGTSSCRIEVQGIDELFREYKKQGVIYSPDTVVVEQPWGDREFPALDHHRNLLTFYEII